MIPVLTFAEYAGQLREYIAQPPLPLGSEAIQESRFDELARCLFRLQFESHPVYRQFCQSRRITPESLARWQDIPAISTQAFKELDWSCLPESDRPFVFHTSGTTQERMGKQYHNPMSLALYEDSIRPWFQQHLLPEARPMRILSLTPPKTLAPHSSLVHMVDTVIRAFGLPSSRFLGVTKTDGSWDLDFSACQDTLLSVVAAQEPVMVLGTAFNYVHLLDYGQANGARLALPTGSRVMETGGYKGRSRILTKAELHSMITRNLGIPPTHIIREYGMCELSSQAYDGCIPSAVPENSIPTASGAGSAVPRFFQFPPWAKAVIVSPETGDTVEDQASGLVRLLDLANAWSAMGLQTEDLAVRHGAGFELLGRKAQAEPRGCSLNS